MQKIYRIQYAKISIPYVSYNVNPADVLSATKEPSEIFERLFSLTYLSVQNRLVTNYRATLLDFKIIAIISVCVRHIVFNELDPSFRERAVIITQVRNNGKNKSDD